MCKNASSSSWTDNATSLYWRVICSEPKVNFSCPWTRHKEIRRSGGTALLLPQIEGSFVFWFWGYCEMSLLTTFRKALWGSSSLVMSKNDQWRWELQQIPKRRRETHLAHRAQTPKPKKEKQTKQNIHFTVKSKIMTRIEWSDSDPLACGKRFPVNNK